MNLNVGEDTSQYIQSFLATNISNIKELDAIKNCEQLNYKKYNTFIPNLDTCYSNKFPKNRKYLSILDENNEQRALECCLIYKKYDEKTIKYFSGIEKINNILKNKKQTYLTNKVFYKRTHETNKGLDFLKNNHFIREFNIIKFEKGVYNKIINSKYYYVNLFILLREVNDLNDVFSIKTNGKEIVLIQPYSYFYNIFYEDGDILVNSTTDIFLAQISFEFEHPKI